MLVLKYLGFMRRINIMMKKVMAFAAAAVLAGALVTGCGAKESETTAAPETTAVTEATTEAAPTEAVTEAAATEAGTEAPATEAAE